MLLSTKIQTAKIVQLSVKPGKKNSDFFVHVPFCSLLKGKLCQFAKYMYFCQIIVSAIVFRRIIRTLKNF